MNEPDEPETSPDEKAGDWVWSRWDWDWRLVRHIAAGVFIGFVAAMLVSAILCGFLSFFM